MKHKTLHKMKRFTLLAWILVLGLAFASITFVSAQEPTCTTTCYVNGTTGSNGNGGASAGDALATVQFAVDRVQANGEVIVASGTYDQSVTITKSLTLTGAGADVTTLSATNADTIMISNVVESIVVTISGFSIEGDFDDGLNVANGETTVNNSTIFGAIDDGIANTGTLTLNQTLVTNNGDHGIFNNGMLTINHSTIDGNVEDGIFNEDAVVISNSTISGNGDEGIKNGDSSTSVTLNFVTIAFNSLGIDNTDGQLVVANSLIADNTRFDCFSVDVVELTVVGDNLHTDGTCAGIPQVSSANLALQALADNGGSTPTHALGITSDAIDAVTSCEFVGGGSVNTDQRGIARPQGSACDVGAYEDEAITGALEVTKVVVWGDIPVNPAQTFEICITGPSHLQGDCQEIGANGGDLLWDNLLPGDYSVDETTPSGNWNVQEPSPVSVAVGQTATATVTNTNTTPTTGDIDVTKIVNWSGFDPNQAVIFEICVTGPSYPQGDCQFTDFDGGVLSWDDLTPGAYTVDEVDPVANWSVQEHNAPVIVVAGETATATVINTYTPPQIGSITVTKNVDWNGVDVDNGQTFVLCINGDGTNNIPDCLPVGANGGSVTFSNIPTGAYDVYELDPGSQWTASGGANGLVLTIGSHPTVTITNVHDEVIIEPPPVCDAETDLTGWYVLGATSVTGTVRNNNSITCEYQIGMASYLMYDRVIDNQDIYDQTNMIVTLAPGQEVNLTVNLPDCATQFDLFYGETLQSLDGQRYGDRLLAFLQHTDPGFCVADTPE